MQLRKGLRGIAAAALSAATLLSLGISGVANADTNVSVSGNNGKITITNVQAGHTLKFIKLAEYQAAQAVDATPTSRLTNVAYSTTTNTTVRPLVQAAADAANGSPTPGDPMNWVGSNLASSPAAPYDGTLRNFVTDLTAGANFTALAGAADYTESATVAPSFEKNDFAPGIYLILDTTGVPGGHGVAGAGAAIPMLVSTTIGDHDKLGTSDLSAAPIGTVHMKNDDRKLTKELTEVNGNAVVAGQQFNIGDELTYVLKTKAPNLTGYQLPYYFHVQDYPSAGLDYVANSSSVTIDGVAQTVTPTLNATPKYINWNLSNVLTQTMYNKDIVITYKVKITQGGAQSNSASMFTPTNPSLTPPPTGTLPGGPGAPGPNVDETPGVPAPGNPSIPTNPVINPFGVKFKHFVQGTSQMVTGAKYKVYNVTNGNNNLLMFTANSGDYVNTTGVGPGSGTDPVVTVPASGFLSIKGLSAGTYKFDMIDASTDSPFPLKHTFEVTVDNDGTFTNTADIWQLVTANTIRVDTAVDPNVGLLDVPDAATASQLPITGGAGIILVVALAVLAGGAVVVTSVMRRRALMTAKK